MTRRPPGSTLFPYPALFRSIDLFDSAVRAVAALDEPPATNPLAARVAADRGALEAAGAAPEEAELRAGYRIFGSKPGAYGDRKSTRLNSSHLVISYAVFCLT